MVLSETTFLYTEVLLTIEDGLTGTSYFGDYYFFIFLQLNDGCSGLDCNENNISFKNVLEFTI